MVLRQAVVEGAVELGPGSVVHPLARIAAPCSPVRLGPRCVVEEYVCIETPVECIEAPITAGADNRFCVGCSVGGGTPAPITIGANNEFGVHCVVPCGVTVGDNCVVGPTVVLRPGQELPDNTVLVANGGGSDAVAGPDPRRGASSATATVSKRHSDYCNALRAVLLARSDQLLAQH
eukprot:TRINITY_DN1991_c0_g1_i2.p1 TRINITY_DN1991_c0_g1~~TRINITY_DN1991_c0_g1_i2.p1  ORF type:complete len:206 (-),score=52.10 TRINITY_DN1991_c0_g1_i2:160-690(-)